jgi:outer membrane protein OmpA-like peptidoglycan-associated protein
MRVIALFVALASPACALDLTFPAGTETGGAVLNLAPEHILPVSGFIDGKVERRAFTGTRLDTVSRVSPAQPVDALTEALIAQLGAFKVVFDCRTNICGGFDFRFSLDVQPEPEMHVDLTDFRYVIAVNPAGDQAVAFVVSRSSLASFVQVTEISPEAEPSAPVTLPETPELPVKPITPITEAGAGVGGLLDSDGRAVLEDLVFATGSADLGEGDFASLTELAAWLEANPEVRVAIVGHTDAVGGADANISLSRKRAASVVERLTGDLGVQAARVEALGAGYMAPRATNLTDEGRQSNRRVEVVVISTN